MSPGLKTWLLAARLRTLPAAIAPVALGSAFAAREMHFKLVPALLCAAFALLAQIGANFANDYFDFRQGADTANRLGPKRAVASGLVKPAAMLRATLLALALAAVAGSCLIFYGGWWLVLIGAASLLGALAYSGGPFPLAYHGLGEVCAIVFFGFVAVLGTFLVQAGLPTAPAPWLAALGCGLLAANILLVNNIRDLNTDKGAGKRTLAVRVGRPWAQRFYAANLIVVVAITLMFFLVDWNLWLVPALASAVPLGAFFIRVLRAIPEGDGPRFNHLLAQSAQFMALWALLMSLGIALE